MAVHRPAFLFKEKHTYLIPFLEFLLMYLVPTFRRAAVSWLWRRPTGNSLAADSMLDLCHGKRELMMENALLRQQLTVLRRQVPRPQLTSSDRLLLVLLASRLRT